MTDAVEEYLSYLSTQKRFSVRTVKTYSDVLERYYAFVQDDSLPSRSSVRAYQIFLLDNCALSPRSVNLHLSILSGYCRHLVQMGLLRSNPVLLVSRPKQSARLPVFFKEGAMRRYLESDNALKRGDFNLELQSEAEIKDTYGLCLNRIIVSVLFSTGVRRAELISLRMKDFDSARKVMHVRGKGDKMREIPLVDAVIEEILLYLQAKTKLAHCEGCTSDSPLFTTLAGAPLYPMLVDRAVKSELGVQGNDFAGRKSPHVLRHTLATGLLEEGADLNSIKEVLGHANLAATQIYTHSDAARLKAMYEKAHPLAGGRRK